MNSKSVVNIHCYEDRHIAVYSVCFPSAIEDSNSAAMY